MKIVRLIQFFTLLFVTNFLSANVPIERTLVKESDLFMGDGRIIVYSDGEAVELNKICLDNYGYSYSKGDIKCKLLTLKSVEKSHRQEDRKWFHCRKCGEDFRTEYQLDRHMVYDHYHAGSRR